VVRFQVTIPGTFWVTANTLQTKVESPLPPPNPKKVLLFGWRGVFAREISPVLFSGSDWLRHVQVDSVSVEEIGEDLGFVEVGGPAVGVGDRFAESALGAASRCACCPNGYRRFRKASTVNPLALIKLRSVPFAISA
jgi:hypothetical protein